MEIKGNANNQRVANENAVTTAKSEDQSATIPAKEEVEKKHADELKALEERLRAEHKKELEVAAAKIVPGGTTDDIRKTDIEAAITAAKAEWEKAKVGEIEEAIERGRVEQQTKGRLKDAQLTRTQTRVKELEAKIMELQGSITTSTSKTTTVAPTQKPTPTQPPTQKLAQPSAQKPAPAQTPGQKPTPIINKPQQTATQTRLPNRPTPPTRGGGPGRVLGGRGGAPITAPTQSTGGGVSIMGAAKRPREDTEGEAPIPDNSLAKRLKPAENKPTPPIKRPPPKQ